MALVNRHISIQFFYELTSKYWFFIIQHIPFFPYNKILSKLRLQNNLTETDSENILYLQVSNNLGPGGAERQLVNTSLGLLNKQLRVSILCNSLDKTNDQFFLKYIDSKLEIHQTNSLFYYSYNLSKSQISHLNRIILSSNIEYLTLFLPPSAINDLIVYIIKYQILKP
ncbi:MAG: hypothetical protein ACE5RC_04260, partial [Nitrosopumilus sp.]